MLTESGKIHNKKLLKQLLRLWVEKNSSWKFQQISNNIPAVNSVVSHAIISSTK